MSASTKKNDTLTTDSPTAPQNKSQRDIPIVDPNQGNSFGNKIQRLVEKDLTENHGIGTITISGLMAALIKSIFSKGIELIKHVLDNGYTLSASKNSVELTPDKNNAQSHNNSGPTSSESKD